jgi:hypothetical protein
MMGLAALAIVLAGALIVYELSPEARSSRVAERACQGWDLEEFEAYRSAHEAGDASAAQCWLAVERGADLHSDYETPPVLWLGQGYWIWKATGEPVEEALAAARTIARSEVVAPPIVWTRGAADRSSTAGTTRVVRS